MKITSLFHLMRLWLVVGFVFAVLLLVGWIYQTRTIPAGTEYLGSFKGGTEVHVQIKLGNALEIATQTALEYRAHGWEELPVSTDTFKLFTRGKRTAAFLAEDTPQGVRLTEFSKGREF